MIRPLKASRHASFGGAAALSLALHGVALGAVLWGGPGFAPPEPVALETVPMVMVTASATEADQPAVAADTVRQTRAAAPTAPPAPATPRAESMTAPEGTATRSPATAPPPTTHETSPPDPTAERTAAPAPPTEPAEPPARTVPIIAPPPQKPAVPPASASSGPPPPPETARAPKEREAAPRQSAARPHPPSEAEIAPAAGRTATSEKPPRFGVDGLANPSPDYPWLARRAGEEGRVVLRVAVDAAGTARHVEIVRSSGHRRLDQAALEALRKWTFKPARRGGAAVPGTVEVPVTFRLSEK